MDGRIEIRATKQDRENIEAVKKLFGLRATSEAVRYCVKFALRTAENRK